MSPAKPKIQGAEWRAAASLALHCATELLQGPTSNPGNLEQIEGCIQDAMRAVQTMKAARRMTKIESSYPGLIDQFRAGATAAAATIDLKRAIDSVQPLDPISIADAKRMIEIAALRSDFGRLDARIFNPRLLEAVGGLEAFNLPKYLQVGLAARKQAHEQGLASPSSEDINTFREYWGHVFLYGDVPKVQHTPGPVISDEDGSGEGEDAGQRPSAK